MPARQKPTGGKRLDGSNDPTTVDGLLEAAAGEEERATRFLSDLPKAARALEEALRLLRLASQQDEGATIDDIARCAYTLAVTTDSAADRRCLARIQESIELYRRSATLDPDSFDTLFNVASALVDFADMLDDGVGDDSGQDTDAISVASWQEARQIFLRVEEMQKAAMQAQDLPPDDGMREEGSTSGSEGPVTGEVEVGQVVVPPVIVDTILAFADASTSLLSATTDPAQRSAIWTELSQALERAKEIDSSGGEAIRIAQAEAEALVARAKSDCELAPTAMPNLPALQRAVDTLVNVVAADRGIETLSALADARSTAADLILRYLYAKSTAPRLNDSEAFGYALQLLSEAFGDYDAVRDLLEAPMLSRDASVKRISPPQFAPTLSSVLTSLTMITLTLGVIQVEQGAGITLDGAVRLSKRSLDVLPALPARQDWHAAIARRNAALVACRVGGQVDGQLKEIVKATGGSATSVKDFVETIRGDAVFATTGGKELAMFEQLANALAL